MKNKVWNTRLPTLLGLFAIAIGVFITSSLVKQGTIFQGNATPSETPENVRITNITDTSFTVSYTTEATVSGSITFGKDKNLGNTALDERDQEGKVDNHSIHYIKAGNLEPSTTYLFEIISNQTSYLNDKSLFQISTAPTLSTSPPTLPTISGKVTDSSGQAPNEAVVYANSKNSQTFSVLTKNDGTYTLPLAGLRTDDLSAFSSDVEQMQLLVLGESLESSATFLLSSTTSIPTIILSKNYDFTLSSPEIATPSASLGFPSLTATASASFNPSITAPKANEGLSDQQPNFTGKAKPGAIVKISIQSPDEIQTQVTADNNGNWNYRPTAPLSVGQHTISITTTDSLGILKTITQSFTVYAAGSQVGQSATPSATLSVPSITSTPTPLVTTTPIPSPPITLSPTPFLTPLPTLPQTGTSSVDKGIFGVVTMAFGALLFLLARFKAL